MDESLLDGFVEYLKSMVSPETARDYRNVVERREWPPVKRSHVKAWRHYVRFLFSLGLIGWEQEQLYLAYLRLPKRRPTTRRAVSVEEAASALRGLGEYRWLAGYLLGGSRLKHIVEMLSDYRPGEVVRHVTGEYAPREYCSGVWCRYYVGVARGSKRCIYIYYLRITGRGPLHTYDTIKKRLLDNGVRVGLFRKFANQVLEQLAYEHNIRLDAVNLVMSRELSVTGANYLNTRDWADRLFDLYARWLESKGLL